MRTKFYILALLLTCSLSSCMKHASDQMPLYGEVDNTWIFSDGNKLYMGSLPSGAILYTTPHNNNTYTLEITGSAHATGEIFTMTIALNQPKASTGNFQSGIDASDLSNAFYYTGSAASRDAIYISSNTTPGAILNIDIVQYDEVSQRAIVKFSGQAFDAAGNLVNISKGRLTAKVSLK